MLCQPGRPPSFQKRRGGSAAQRTVRESSSLPGEQARREVEALDGHRLTSILLYLSSVPTQIHHHTQPAARLLPDPSKMAYNAGNLQNVYNFTKEQCVHRASRPSLRGRAHFRPTVAG